jgi:cystathionine beta-lyase
MSSDNESLATKLSHIGRAGKNSHGFVNLPVPRGSTVLYPDMATRKAFANAKYDQALTYGLQGSEIHHALEDAVAAVEGGTRCQIVSSGLAAVTTPLLAYLGAGDQVLMPDSVYGPSRIFIDGIGKRLGMSAIWYDPNIDAASLAALITPATKILYLESPGSHTFEMQDVPALAAAAHASGLCVMIDNSWGFGHFDPFAHGVDVSIQALTKYAVGHSDVVIGAVITNDDQVWRKIRATALDLGQYASPDDVWLTLRGMRTLLVRQKQQMATALEVARFLTDQKQVARVLYPALPGAEGHAIWARDFSGAASLFGVEFMPGITVAETDAMADQLKLFGIGASWGGYESLILPTTGLITRKVTHQAAGPMMRLHIGLEAAADLIADLKEGLKLCMPQ